MRKLIAVLAVAGVSLAAAPVFAGEPAWSDSEFLSANRCLGLAQSKDLGVVDATALIAKIKQEGRGRIGYVRDRADEMRSAALRDGRTRSETVRAKLTAERDGVCKVYLGATVAAN
ncbi:hypothetical protein [Caulobacter vibrioides]|jgi:hypothetical protein|uniref:Uncharacterized protein n=1 Tax=Caulobacter vibrioides OR37 TaxID=1292034 RepID=R0CYM7_CAUVI|nr:hypothetical protein [Caulobacter vibrioides]ENZ81571.1 hypothetical protein OR37_02509 [Caulobacter vibrioides OR37]